MEKWVRVHGWSTKTIIAGGYATEAHNHHHLHINWDTLELDTHELTAKEKHFLYTALVGTLETYMEANRLKLPVKPEGVEDDPPLYLGHLTTAIGVAFSLCERSRRRRAEYIMKLEKESSCQ